MSHAYGSIIGLFSSSLLTISWPCSGLAYTADWDQFRADLCARYDFKDLKDLKWFLGIRVIRDRQNRKLWLCQDAYIERIASRFHLNPGKSATPMTLDDLGAYYPEETPSKQAIYGCQQLTSRCGSNRLEAGRILAEPCATAC